MIGRPKPKSKRRLWAYSAFLGISLAVGFSPLAFTYVVDPYEVFGDMPRPTKITDLAEKAHYPLYRLAKYKPGDHDIIVLGDSRARALRDKYWHELGMSGALNLSYGGGTIPEIYETFKVIRNDEAVKSLVIGIQLRSFDEDHKGGMNRVPEAVDLLAHKFDYLQNWTVIKSAWRVFRTENKDTIEKIQASVPTMVGAASAAEITHSTKVLGSLLDPKICFSCSFSKDLESLPLPRRIRFNSGFHRQHYFSQFGVLDRQHWNDVSDWYVHAQTFGDLNKKFEKQISGSGKADWLNFEFSQNYWNHLVEISQWAKENGKGLYFVIPPTVTKLQNTIEEGGLSHLNHQFRVELSKLGTVLDFDFPNAITNNVENFSDAYHFNSKMARKLTGEIAGLISKKIRTTKRYRQHAGDFSCFDQAEEPGKTAIIDGLVQVRHGLNCRVWRGEVQ